ncbi:ABC transporter permease [Rhodococcus erythropolis]|uniref:ABC transporter permease n=1 Tax=Rhodococcus erythropolis TaxID=1833 RepID=A0A5N5E9K6_RHOER|nr:ABC transporter permease [Rhodococcus erythropolis]
MTLTSEAVPDAPSRAHPVGDRGYVPFLLATAVVLATVSTVAVWSGAASLSFADVFAVLYAHAGGPPVDPLLDRIVWGLRVPRILIAALAGAGLSLAGAVLQALVRNPIADPYILGVGSGASFGAVLIMTTGIGTGLSIGVPVAAFLGAMVSLIAVLVLGRREGMLVPLRMVLAGVAIGYLLSAATSFVQLRADPSQLSGVLFWLLGSVSGAGWSDLGVPAAVITVCAAVLLTQSRQLNALAMGDESAQSVGVDVRRTRLLLLVIASLLTAVVVSVAGGIGFVGLLVPHAVRLLVGSDHRKLLPATALVGATFLVIVDLASRMLDAPNELPLGIITAGLGAPFFLWLLRREGGAQS